MKKTTLFLFLFLLILASCEKEDSFTPIFTTNLESENITFPSTGGVHSFELESNESWSIDELPEWLSVEVKDRKPSTRSTNYTEGSKEVTLLVKPNTTNTARSTKLLMTAASGSSVQLVITQEKKPELVGYWILSEGNLNKNDSELAWYDAATNELHKKQFAKVNDKPLGDTGNDLQLYGSKMYCLISGPGFGAESTEGTNYIEVIDPANGKSIKRIPFVDAKGKPAKPRYIVFDQGKGYVSSYSNEVVRIDTAMLSIDAHAPLAGGTLPEGLTLHNGKIFVCNSGQGVDETISVVDAVNMKEEKVITTAKNPTGIAATSDGIIYFNTNYPDYALYRFSASDEKISRVEGVNASFLTFFNNKIYTCSFNWDSYEGAVNEIVPATGAVAQMDLDMASEGVDMLMEYKIGGINGSENIFISGMGQDVLIVNPDNKTILHAFETGVANGSGVVAYYK